MTETEQKYWEFGAWCRQLPYAVNEEELLTRLRTEMEKRGVVVDESFIDFLLREHRRIRSERAAHAREKIRAHQQLQEPMP